MSDESFRSLFLSSFLFLFRNIVGCGFAFPPLRQCVTPMDATSLGHLTTQCPMSTTSQVPLPTTRPRRAPRKPCGSPMSHRHASPLPQTTHKTLAPTTCLASPTKHQHLSPMRSSSLHPSPVCPSFVHPDSVHPSPACPNPTRCSSPRSALCPGPVVCPSPVRCSSPFIQ
jgi:hypothetical protein